MKIRVILFLAGAISLSAQAPAPLPEKAAPPVVVPVITVEEEAEYWRIQSQLGMSQARMTGLLTPAQKAQEAKYKADTQKLIEQAQKLQAQLKLLQEAADKLAKTQQESFQASLSPDQLKEQKLLGELTIQRETWVKNKQQKCGGEVEQEPDGRLGCEGK